MTTVYFTGRYSPSGNDFLRVVRWYKDQAGVYIWTSHDSKSIFYPWDRIERISE